MKAVPQADAKSASMGWFFDPGFIQNVQRVASDIENPSMESIDSVLFALREMGYIKTASTCEHGFSVDECVTGICELQTEHAALRARLAEVETKLGRWQEDMNAVLAQRDDYHANFAPLAEALREISNMKIPYCDADDVAHSMRDIAREALAKLEEK